eukprot:Gb_36634 [translate_table: standard]
MHGESMVADVVALRMRPSHLPFLIFDFRFEVRMRVFEIFCSLLAFTKVVKRVRWLNPTKMGRECCENVVADNEGNEIFRVESCGSTVKDQSVIKDGEGRPIFTVRHKILVIRNPLLKVMSCSISPKKSPVKVLLASSNAKKHWDYEIEDWFSKRKWTI